MSDAKIISITICSAIVIAIVGISLVLHGAREPVAVAVPAIKQSTKPSPILAPAKQATSAPAAKPSVAESQRPVEAAIPRTTEVAALPVIAPVSPPIIATPVRKLERTFNVAGAAYVVRKNGQSDILRGFHINLISNTVPEATMRAAIQKAISNLNKSEQEYRTKAADQRSLYSSLTNTGYDPGKYFEDEAKNDARKSLSLKSYLAKLAGPIDSVAALRLLEATDYVNVIRDVVDVITIAKTTTNVDGKYKISSAPIESLVFAMFDTSDGFLLWAVPVKGEDSIDLFNDTAMPTHSGE